jgi:8-oxo-dGTP pyrophosphatase MutT (NUDIX family)
VILVRKAASSVEVFLVRRHRKSGFMSDAFVFPGGKMDPEDGSREVAALRELFEEAGVLIVDGALDPERQAAWRRRLCAGETTFSALLHEEGLTPATGKLHPWAQWITPSVEPKRFDAQFYVAELPPGQTPSFDQKETVEEVWITPADAVARHETAGFRLPPPQLRTLFELIPFAEGGLSAILGEAHERRAHAHPILPRFAQEGPSMALLLPWDPEYDKTPGDGISMPKGHYLGKGPSRFLLEGMTWKLGYAPGVAA